MARIQDQKAYEAFQAKQKQAAELAEKLARRLRRYAQIARLERRIDWAHVGSLGHAVEELTELNRFMEAE